MSKPFFDPELVANIPRHDHDCGLPHADDKCLRDETERRRRVADEMRREPGRIPDGATLDDCMGRTMVTLPPEFTVNDFFAAANVLVLRR